VGGGGGGAHALLDTHRVEAQHPAGKLVQVCSSCVLEQVPPPQAPVVQVQLQGGGGGCGMLALPTAVVRIS
jgi:hypothetical protein